MRSSTLITNITIKLQGKINGRYLIYIFTNFIKYCNIILSNGNNKKWKNKTISEYLNKSVDWKAVIIKQLFYTCIHLKFLNIYTGWFTKHCSSIFFSFIMDLFKLWVIYLKTKLSKFWDYLKYSKEWRYKITNFCLPNRNPVFVL